MSIELPKLPPAAYSLDLHDGHPVVAYSVQQMYDFANAARQEAARLALEAAAKVCDAIYHDYACDESAGECVKAIRLLKDNT